ncbi:hypothetical protein M405DRAFT_736951 [Rhizopogon salebrosus TDB-379]|nr:hypothetical protein M405DRAFT_736951 [Rhizopogon salebrosus TDB-379]
MLYRYLFSNNSDSNGYLQVQYTCEPEELPSGEVRPRCFPLPRIFRICPDRPAVEITKFLKIDLKTGEIEIPDESRSVIGPCA